MIVHLLHSSDIRRRKDKMRNGPHHWCPFVVDFVLTSARPQPTSRLSKRKEAPHDGLQPSGCDGAMLSEKAQTRQLGFMVNIQRDPTRHATDTSGRRKCFSGDEGRLTSKMPHDGWRPYLCTYVVYMGSDIRTGEFLTRLLGPNE